MDKVTIFYCPGCGLVGGDGSLAVSTGCKASMHCWQFYQKLILYTFSLGDKDFVHQHVIDAYTAQHSSDELKGIQICFALIGLYLLLEQGYSGKMVQKVHRQLAQKTKDWPRMVHVDTIKGLNVSDVLLQGSDDTRARLIHEWCGTVWKAWETEQANVINLYTISTRART